MDRASDVLEAMRALGPKLAERAAEVEQLGTFPPDLHHDFVATEKCLPMAPTAMRVWPEPRLA